MRILFSLAFVSILFSCGKDDDSDPNPSQHTPTFLKVGTKYTMYVDDGFWNQDTLKTVVDKQLATDTFLIRNYSETIATAYTQYWVLKDNNFYTSIRLRDPSTYQIECKFGQPVGTSWQVKKNNQTYNYSIAALNVSITTGDGVVTDAIKIKVKAANGQESFQYMSPTVGMLGSGSVNDPTAVAKVIRYTIGTAALTGGTLPRITFGSFPFLAVGKYWSYKQSDIFGDEIDVTLQIESKLPNQNIFKTKLTYGSEVSYAYWFEDNGMLMVYEQGETIANADPIYMSESIATVGYGWMASTPSGTTFFYKIIALNEQVDSYFGTLPSMEIEVSDGLFGIESNYWNKDKGNILVSGMVSRDVVGSNARAGRERPFIPIVCN